VQAQRVCLALSLRKGHVFVAHFLSFPRGLLSRTRTAFRAAGTRLFFLPQYSPDLNPIEQVFAKLKTLLRKAAKRTIEDTWRQIGTLLRHFPPQECANYFRNAGYASI
jgi:transposase